MLDRSQWLSDWQHECLIDIVMLFTLSIIFTRQSIKLRAGAFYILSLDTFIAVSISTSFIFSPLSLIYVRITHSYVNSSYSTSSMIIVADYKEILLGVHVAEQYAIGEPLITRLRFCAASGSMFSNRVRTSTRHLPCFHFKKRVSR